MDLARIQNMSRSEQWIPLEANEDILNGYIAKMGVCEGQVVFNEIFGFDALEFVPRPVKAVKVRTTTLYMKRTQHPYYSYFSYSCPWLQ